jgi:hypothetical protein
MKELILQVESLEERIAPCCCDPSLISANPTVTVNGNYNQLNTGPQTNLAFVDGSYNNTQQLNNQQNANNGAHISSVYQSI